MLSSEADAEVEPVKTFVLSTDSDGIDTWTSALRSTPGCGVAIAGALDPLPPLMLSVVLLVLYDS